jgi:hypothetical protein
VLQRRDEGELDGLALLVASLGRGVPVLDGESLVRIRLDPHGFDERLAEISRRFGGGAVVLGKNPLRPAGDRIQANVRGNPVEPRVQRAAAFELRQSAPGVHKRLLESVLGIVQRAQHAIAVGLQRRVMLVDDLTEGALVAGPSGVEQFLLAHRICPRDSHGQ